MVKNLFWTGGFDSTFRLLQLIELEEVKSINIYYLALNIDNQGKSTLKRRSTKNEVISIRKVLNLVDKSKINKFFIYGSHRELIEIKIILQEFNFIEYVIREEIEYSKELTSAYSNLFKVGIVPREKSQYGSITQILDELNIKAEVCIEKDGGIFQEIWEVVDEDGLLIEQVQHTELGSVFGKYEMPLFWISKESIINESTYKRWLPILNETWSCWYPVDDKPCQNCFACERRPYLTIQKQNFSKTKSDIIDEIYKIEPDFKYFSDYEISNIYRDEDKLYLGSSFGKIGYDDPTKMRKTANIATQPKRFYNLLLTLDSIKDQFDEVRLYLNEYKSIPDELKQYTCYIGKDLTDNGKMYWSNNDNEYYFTLDDDIIYPPDYVEKTIPHIKDRIVSYHGKKLLGIGQSFYRSNQSFLFHKHLKEDTIIDIGGTGVMAFNTNIFKPTLWKSPIYKMCDILISIEATLYNLPIVCLAHEKEWIKTTSGINSKSGSVFLNGIAEEYLDNDDKQSAMADMIQVYKDNQIRNEDLISKAGSVDKKDIYKINEIIDRHKKEHKTFYHIGSGDGKLICQMSLISQFSKYIGIDNVLERIRFSHSLTHLIEVDNVEFKKMDFSEIEFEEDSIVFINDITMKSTETINIWKKLPNGSHLICHHILPKVFPVENFQVFTSWNKFLQKELYYYLKD